MIAGISLVLAQWFWLVRRDNSFSVGQPSPETYRVISHMRYDDLDAVKALRSMVSESVVGVTVRDVSAKSRLQRWIEALSETSANDSSSSSTYLSRLPEALLNAIANLNNNDKSRILNLAYQVGSAYIDSIASGTVTLSESETASSLWAEINRQVSSVSDANFVYQILAGLGNLNLKFDDDLTQLAKRAAANDVPELDRRLEPGDVIVPRGEIITPQTALLLRLQGYTEDVFPTAQIYVVIAVVLALPLWLDILRRGAGDKRTTWWSVVTIIIIAWTFEVLAARLGIAGAGTLPAAVFAYLCIPDYLAFCLSLIASVSGVFIVAGQTISKTILISAMSMVSVTFGFYILRGHNIESKKQLAGRVVLMALILVMFRIFVRMLQGSISFQQEEFWHETFLLFVFDALASQIVLLVLPFIEDYIGVLSIITLREVSYPSSPLLRELQRKAPGTYQHCLTIATLIEAVGIKLGMDVNLLRAGAYYHDIGKLRRPQFFVENQGGGVNLHDDMSPMLSSLTIMAHVKDGLEMAMEAKLPRRIRDFIAEHHGTTCTRYFYNKALSEGEKVEREDFCYPGPEPRSRETALLMITDSVEAAVRAANIRELEADDSNRTKGKSVSAIERIVNQVVDSKINEKQFNNVNFTFKDLTCIKETLISVLISMYHTRKVKKIENRK